MDVLLLNDVAAARPHALVDERRGNGRLPPRTLSTVDEAQRVPIIEVAEGVNLIVGTDRRAQSAHDLARQLEAHVESRGAQVEEQVSRRRGGTVLSSLKCLKIVQVLGTRYVEETTPHACPNTDDAAEHRLGVTETNGPGQPGHSSQQIDDDGLAPAAYCHREEDRCLGRRGQNLLREVLRVDVAHGFTFKDDVDTDARRHFILGERLASAVVLEPVSIMFR